MAVYSHRNTRANFYLLGRPNTSLSREAPEVAVRLANGSVRDTVRAAGGG
jgi:hypothetical protein